MLRTEPTVSYEYVLPGAAGLRQTGRLIARRAARLAQRPDVQRLATEIVRGAGVPAKDHAGEARVLWEIMAGERPYITPDGRELTMRYQREYGEVIRDPDVLLLEGAGDCDDFSLFLLATLGALGFEGDAVVMRRTNAAGVAEWHVYPVVHPPDGSQALVLDATPVLPEGPVFDWAAPNDGPGNVWAYEVRALPDPIGAVVDTVIGLVQDVVGGSGPSAGSATASRVFAGARAQAGLGFASAGAGLGAAEPQSDAAFPGGTTREVAAFEHFGPSGWERVTEARFDELEAQFRAADDAMSLESLLRWGIEEQTVAEVRWATRTLPSSFWFPPNGAQWGEYTSGGIVGDPVAGRATCWEGPPPFGRQRHCRVVRQWRATEPEWSMFEAAPAPEPKVFPEPGADVPGAIVPVRGGTPTGPAVPGVAQMVRGRGLVTLVALGAAALFGWSQWQRRAG